jgi:hypothetical protein
MPENLTETTKQTLYKILSPEGDSLHGGKLRWDLPKLNTDGTYTPGNWHSAKGKIEACENGLHLTPRPYRWYTWDCAVYEAEGRGDCDTHNGKVAYREARLLRPVQHPQWWLDAHRFVEAIPATRFMKPDAKPLKEWKLFTASTLNAARDAARAAAWDAAWDAARDAAWDAEPAAAWDAEPAAAWDAEPAAAWDTARDAAWDTARDAARAAAMAAARDAAWGVAWDAAPAAALDAAWYAAWYATRAAAWDAALYVQTHFICRDLKLDPQHVQHAADRWRVWQKGYCLLCDVDGILYVYAADK